MVFFFSVLGNIPGLPPIKLILNINRWSQKLCCCLQFFKCSQWTKYNVLYLRWLDGDASFLFILSCVCKSSFTCSWRGDDTCLADEWIGQGRFTVIYVSNYGHVSDIMFFVHNGPDLVYRKVHLKKNNKLIHVY